MKTPEQLQVERDNYLRWINEAPTPEERNRRKVLMHTWNYTNGTANLLQQAQDKYNSLPPDPLTKD